MLNIGRMGSDKYMEASQKRDITIDDLAREGTLDELQQKLSAVTGLAFLTVNFRGEPVTNTTGFTKHCAFRRNYSYYEKNCILSNAFGGAAAAISNEPYIYKCHAGLLHIAVSIVIRNQYMGTLIGGQIKCLDAPLLDDFGERLTDDVDWTKDKELCNYFKNIPVMEYKKIKQIADLVALCVRQICEKETFFLERKEYELEKERLSAKRHELMEKETRFAEQALLRKKEQVNSHMILNVLNLVAGLACIEDAEQTEEMVHLLIQLIHYQLKEDEVLVSLNDELEHVDHYLRIQKLRFEDKLMYELIKAEHLEEQTMIPKIVLPFVENAIIHGVLAKKGLGKIRICCYVEDRDCVIAVEDEGTTITQNQTNKVYEPLQGYYENSRVSTEILTARQRLMKKYGPKYDVQIFSNGEEGTRVMIRIPRSVERIRYDV